MSSIINVEVHPLYDLRLKQPVQFDTYDNKVVCRYSDGKCPFGIVVFITKTEDSSYLASIDASRQIIDTEEFDVHQQYPINATVFVNKNGKFSSMREDINNPGIGIVISPPTPMNNSLKMLWL